MKSNGTSAIQSFCAKLQKSRNERRGDAMTLEEVVAAKLEQLPQDDRERVLALIDQWIEQVRRPEAIDAEKALAAVKSTWATVTLDPKTARWVAEDKALEYEIR